MGFLSFEREMSIVADVGPGLEELIKSESQGIVLSIWRLYSLFRGTRITEEFLTQVLNGRIALKNSMSCQLIYWLLRERATWKEVAWV